jgi:hypothetical protein
LFQGIAEYLRLDLRVFGSHWLSDLMIASFYQKDPLKLTTAKRLLGNKKCFNANLVWKQSQHDVLQFTHNSNGVFQGIMIEKKLEAFAFATFDLYAICYDILKLAIDARIGVSIDLGSKDSNWLMVLVTDPTKSPKTIISNTIIIDAIPKQRPFMLGIMHTDISNIKLNDTSKSAKEYTIRVEACTE